MVPDLRSRFNANFTAEKYRALLARLEFRPWACLPSE